MGSFGQESAKKPHLMVIDVQLIIIAQVMKLGETMAESLRLGVGGKRKGNINHSKGSRRGQIAAQRVGVHESLDILARPCQRKTNKRVP